MLFKIVNPISNKKMFLFYFHKYVLWEQWSYFQRRRTPKKTTKQQFFFNTVEKKNYLRNMYFFEIEIKTFFEKIWFSPFFKYKNVFFCLHIIITDLSQNIVTIGEQVNENN